MFEAGDYAGGHTNTIRVDTEYETHHVDTGFIVMNDRNYPHFTRLLDRLGVARQPTHMSFSVKGEHEDFEYSRHAAGPVLPAAQPRQPALPAHDRSTCCASTASCAGCSKATRGATTATRSPSSSRAIASRAQFVERLIVPQASAVWSADPRQMHSFPVRFLAEFFANHGMLGFRDRPRWSTIAGGSARYVEALTAPFRDRIRLRAPVRSIARARRPRRRSSPTGARAHASASTRSSSPPTPTRRSRC